MEYSPCLEKSPLGLKVILQIIPLLKFMPEVDFGWSELIFRVVFVNFVFLVQQLVQANPHLLKLLPNLDQSEFAGVFLESISNRLKALIDFDQMHAYL